MSVRLASIYNRGNLGTGGDVVALPLGMDHLCRVSLYHSVKHVENPHDVVFAE
jgi:hypothetical protein